MPRAVFVVSSPYGVYLLLVVALFMRSKELAGRPVVVASTCVIGMWPRVGELMGVAEGLRDAYAVYCPGRSGVCVAPRTRLPSPILNTCCGQDLNYLGHG